MNKFLPGLNPKQNVKVPFHSKSCGQCKFEKEGTRLYKYVTKYSQLSSKTKQVRENWPVTEYSTENVDL